MLGGVDTALTLWKAEVFSEGLRSMFILDDLIAVCLHADAAFFLAVSISPLVCLKFSSEKITALMDDKIKKEKRLASGARSRQPRNLYVIALNV